jgi:similar to stage IV sporulation protein
VKLWNLQPCREGYEANLSIRDFRRLGSIAKKSHAKVRITQRRGLPFFIRKYKKRKAYLLGMLAALLLMYGLSTRLWNITVDGNEMQSDEVIFDYLDSIEIHHGMAKSLVDCEYLAGQIRNYFTDFSWVAVQMEGTQLMIHVKEGVLLDEEEEISDGEGSSLAAAKGGTVVSIITRNGRPLVQAGDTVETGDLLVSGVLPIYQDDGTLLSCQYVKADADIVLQTTRTYRDVLALAYQKKVYTEQKKVRWSLRIGNTVFALPVSFAGYESCDVLSEQRQLKLLEHFYLPVFLEKYTIRPYEEQSASYTKTEAEEVLWSNFQYFAKKLQEKGVQIFENNVKIKWNEKSAIASGILITREEAIRRVPVEDTEEELLKYEYG